MVTGSDEEGMSKLKECLLSEFEIKDLGSLKIFLGRLKNGSIYFSAKVYSRSSNRDWNAWLEGSGHAHRTKSQVGGSSRRQHG